MAKQKREGFPKRLYVVRAGAGAGMYFETNEDPTEIDDEHGGERIGVYELVETRTLVITRLLK